MIFNFIVLGFQNVWKEKRVIYVELLIQLSSFYYFFNFIDRNTDFNKYTEFTELAIVTMVRNVRAYNLLIETKAVCMIMETTQHISKPILGKFLFVYLIFYCYAQLGLILFSGDLTYKTFE